MGERLELTLGERRDYMLPKVAVCPSASVSRPPTAPSHRGCDSTPPDQRPLRQCLCNKT